HSLSGYYFRQTRFLKDLVLTIDHLSPHVCSFAESTPSDLELTFIHPEVTGGGGGGSGSGGTDAGNGLLYRNLDLRLKHHVRPASVETLLIITSRWQDDVRLRLHWSLTADFATMDEAQFGAAPATAVEITTAASGVRFRNDDRGLHFETVVTGSGADWQYEHGRLGAVVTLRRQQELELRLRIDALDAADPIDDTGSQERESRLEAWLASRTQLHSAAEPPFVQYAERGAIDIGSLALLEGARTEWLTPAAGVPLYQSLWARDALTASWQAGLLDRGEMLQDVLTTLTRLQGARDDPQRDEQPGRILNQAKTDVHSRTGRSGFDRYYADVASPFMFIIGLGYHYALTGDRKHLDSRYDAAARALEWAEHYGDRGHGYIAYQTRAPHGPRHQGWKDSENAVVDEGGRQIEPPIASCEIQGYWYVALQFMAVLALVRGRWKESTLYWRRATDLKTRFNRDFWMDDEGFIAFGLGPGQQPIRALTSNAGQCLATGIVDPLNIPRLVRRLFEPDLFSGWGIRTLSAGNPAYNPLDYHLGSVWPVENATIIFGLRRYGLDDRVLQLVRAVYDLARLWPQGRTPECVGGYGRDELAHPGAYPRANRPQTWNQSVWPLMVQCLLGLVPYAPLNLLMVDPILPPWLPELSIKRLRVGDATVAMRFRRDADGRSHYDITDQQGSLHVIRQPWLESFSADSWERMAALVQTAAH
ncbi:MAG TPA: glycogen debranching N-terminal domain-containing protein, partial [Longimicrobiales bacterium]|nr:glycogen debranching N-terminal domain-containing protein [Longimicrobiales bacterium]